jgi:ABC-2 type transport system ATP-binding protein
MPAISVKNLTKKFGSFTAVNDLSFEAEENHVIGFLGPNGSGKTTTLRMMVGLSKPTKGSIEIAGEKVVFGRVTNKNIGYLPELPSMYVWMSGYEYLTFIAKIFGMSKKAREAKISHLLSLTGLSDAKNRRISAYSGGMKQRLGIAQALLNDPKVLILDEPVSALDPIGRKDVLEVIEKLKNSRTVLFSTHILSDVDRICDDVVIIDEGKLVVSAPLTELKAKYASPILEIDFVSDPKSIISILKQQKWAKKVVAQGNKVKIWLADASAVKQNIPLKLIATMKIGVLKYGLRLPETEDLFISLLGENE